jgi:8-oxo-dGTP pyrophosphatase MutT (NUDIX family)
MAARLEATTPRPSGALAVSSDSVIRAAGGVVWRAATDGEREVLLVHRPKYDDWSLPKGKADGGERPDQTALREVEEETGLRCRLGTEVGKTRYRDSQGRAKVVRYWLMEPESDNEFVPNREVDAVRWCSYDEARAALSYAHDRKLLARALETV